MDLLRALPTAGHRVALQRSKQAAKQQHNEGLVHKDMRHLQASTWAEGQGKGTLSFLRRKGSRVPARNVPDMIASWDKST